MILEHHPKPRVLSEITNQQPSIREQPSIVNRQFSISDTGPGIVRDEMDKLFEAFGQTKTGRQAQEGTGLGLPISRKFVQLMGGTSRSTAPSGRGRPSVLRFNLAFAPHR